MFGKLSNSISELACEVRKLGRNIENSNNNQAILNRLAQIERNIMAAFEDLKTVLGEINGTTNEIAADLDEVIAKLNQPGGLTEAQAQEIVDDLRRHSDTLKGVAAKYPAPPA